MIKRILVSISLFFVSLSVLGQNFVPPEEAFKAVAEYATADQALITVKPA